MANGMTHLMVGGISGLAIALYDKGNKTESDHNPILAIGIGAFFGKLPDVLEPALKNPHHRQFCHSVLVLLAIGYALKKAYEWKPKNGTDDLLRLIVLCAGAGYISHLLLDATTPRSLPLLGKI